MLLHFDPDFVRRLLKHTRGATKHRVLYDDPKTNRPGLWLVGDEGVYLMSNGLPQLRRGPGRRRPARGHKEEALVAYARECDPTTLDFDTWWDNKRASFGGDDGAVFIPLRAIEQGLLTNGDLILEIDDNGVTIRPLTVTAEPRKAMIRPATRTASPQRSH